MTEKYFKVKNGLQANNIKIINSANNDGIVLQGRPGGTDNYAVTITTAPLSANRTYTIPAVSANANFIMSEGTQSINGSIGIGIASSTAKLEVLGDALLHAATTESRFIEIGKNRTGNGYTYIDLIGDATYTDYGLRLIRSNTGPDTSSSLLHRGNGALAITAQDTAPIQLSTASTVRMFLTSGGNVGIGNTNPTEILHVQGSIRVANSYVDAANSKGTAGQVLTSNGTATYWSAIGTASNLVITGSITEDADNTTYTAVTGTVALSAAAGTIQVWTLTGSVTSVTDSLSSGQYITLMIGDGTAYTIAWGSTVVWVGGSAPTLATSGYTVIEIWKVGTVVYGAYVGAVA